MIASGEKKEEYREIKAYWTARLEMRPCSFIPKFKHFDKVVFKNGYGKSAPTISVECLGIELDYSNPDWCDGVVDMFYIIKLGKIL